MLTHFKSLILTSDNIEKCNEQFQDLFGQDVSRLIVDNDSKIYKHHLKNGSVELCESHDERDLFYFKQLKIISKFICFKQLNWRNNILNCTFCNIKRAKCISN